jgi:hypothetical protein
VDVRQAHLKAAICALLVAALAVGAGPAGEPAFHGSIAPVDAALRAGMTSWHAGCPVPIGQLRVLTLTHWGFDRRVHEGRLVVNEAQAANVLRAMRTLFDRRFPIRRMRLVEAYGSDDDRSMAADNTSAFNCRRVAGSPSWSQHAYGLAIDVNPVENPSIRGGVVSPPAGAAFADRTRWAPGMIHARDGVVRAFAAVGWSWGGYWRSPRDYQHFSATGR